MKITNMKIVSAGSTKAFFTVELNGGKLCLNDFKLIEGSKGMFIAPPQRSYESKGETKYANIVYIADKDLLDQIRRAAVAEYEGKVGGGGDYGAVPGGDDGDMPF